MPRRAREKSKAGIYHVVLRGINKQRIFEDDEDYQMSNHVHLLLKEGKEELGVAFRRIGASYVYWYNWKYCRRGHLFQDRYKRGTHRICPRPFLGQCRRGAGFMGLSIRQLEPLTGVSFALIRGA